MSFGDTLNFDFVTDAASRGFPVLACHLAAPCDRPDAASRGFPALACHLATPCQRRCIAWFPSVEMSFGDTLNFDFVTDAASRGFPVIACHLATP